MYEEKDIKMYRTCNEKAWEYFIGFLIVEARNNKKGGNVWRNNSWEFLRADEKYQSMNLINSENHKQNI